MYPVATPLLSLPESLSLLDIPSSEALRGTCQPPNTRQRCVPSGEGLVALGDAIPTLDAYSVLKILPERSLRVRVGVKKALVVVRRALPEPFDLIVLDGYRTLFEQQQLVDFYDAPSKYVASTDADSMRPPHTTGGAVDLTLTWRGAPLAIGTDFDAFHQKAHLDAFESRGDSVVRRLRRVLAHAMQSAGFAAYSPEWWHWSIGDDVWSAAKRIPAVYEIVEQQKTPHSKSDE